MERKWYIKVVLRRKIWYLLIILGVRQYHIGIYVLYLYHKTKNDMEELDVIKELMQAAPMKAAALAKDIDVEYSYVCKVLKGEKPLTDEMLTKICGALGVSTTFEPVKVPVTSKMVLRQPDITHTKINGWDENDKWLGGTWTNAVGDVRPLFRRDPEFSKEQNDIDAVEFRKRYPGKSDVRIEPPFKVSDLKTLPKDVYTATILEAKK